MDPAAVLPLPVLNKGQRVRVTHRILARDDVQTGHVEGVVESIEARPTGSWFAHGKDDRLWLARLLLRKPDGELILINIDPSTRITPLA